MRAKMTWMMVMMINESRIPPMRPPAIPAQATVILVRLRLNILLAKYTPVIPVMLPPMALTSIIKVLNPAVTDFL